MGSTYVLVIKYIKNRGTPFQGQQLPELRLVQMPTQFAQHLENAWGHYLRHPGEFGMNMEAALRAMTGNMQGELGQWSDYRATSSEDASRKLHAFAVPTVHCFLG